MNGAENESTRSKFKVLASRKSELAENSFNTGKKISPIFKDRTKRKPIETRTKPK